MNEIITLPTLNFYVYAVCPSVQLSHSVMSDSFVTPWTAAHQASYNHHQLPELAQTHVH